MSAYQLSEIARSIETARPSGGTLVVAVDGPSGSGKSRLARRLARALGESTLVRMDHVVPGWDGLEASVELIRLPLTDLRAGRRTRYRLWDWETSDWGQYLDRAAAPSVVVEGCGSGARSLSDLVDYVVWVDAPADLRRDRALARDGESYRGHWDQWAAQESAHFATNQTRSRANVVIDGRLPVR